MSVGTNISSDSLIWYAIYQSFTLSIKVWFQRIFIHSSQCSKKPGSQHRPDYRHQASPQLNSRGEVLFSGRPCCYMLNYKLCLHFLIFRSIHNLSKSLLFWPFPYLTHKRSSIQRITTALGAVQLQKETAGLKTCVVLLIQIRYWIFLKLRSIKIFI